MSGSTQRADYDAKMMARLTIQLKSDLYDRLREKPHNVSADHPDVDNLMFAISHLYDMIDEIQKHWTEAFETAHQQ